MNIPNSGRQRALFVIDVQPPYIIDRTRYVVENICNLISRFPYDLYFNVNFSAEPGSLWEKQMNYIVPRDESFHTVRDIETLLRERDAVDIEKKTKSSFKGNVDTLAILQQHSIREIHCVGFTTPDCVTATAYEAFDLGFFTYVIEECCQCKQSQRRHDDALNNLRVLNMTNNSVHEEVDYSSLQST